MVHSHYCPNMAELAKPMMPAVVGNPVTFVKEVLSELAKVVWPSRFNVIRMTIIVITVSLALGLYIGGLDLVFTKITDTLIKK